MSYDLNHWNEPRKSIATKYVHNDFAYVTRGGNIAMYVLKQFDLSPSQAKELTILDYGCGTGRAAAFLSNIFGQVIGYDPNPHCIATGLKENIKADFRPTNLLLTHQMRHVPICDIAFSTNVIEHLNVQDALVMVANLKKKVKEETLLWYSPINNQLLKKYLPEDEWIEKENAAKRGGKIQIDFFKFNQFVAQP